MTVQVFNHNKFALRGRFDGKDYTFAPGKATEAPEDAVRHIFGFDQDPKVGLIRLGVLKPGVTLEAAQEVRDKVQFLAGRMVFEEPQPLPEPEPRGPGKNEEPEDDTEESGKASAQQLAPGGSTEAGAPASAIPVERVMKQYGHTKWTKESY